MKSPSDAPRRIIDLPCGFCKAKPGRPCISVGGKVLSWAHMKRADAFWGGQRVHDRDWQAPASTYLEDVLSLYMPREEITREIRKKARNLGNVDVVKLGIYKKLQQFTSADMDLFRDALAEP